MTHMRPPRSVWATITSLRFRDVPTVMYRCSSAAWSGSEAVAERRNLVFLEIGGLSRVPLELHGLQCSGRETAEKAELGAFELARRWPAASRDGPQWHLGFRCRGKELRLEQVRLVNFG
jgi:hypothetical protein